MTDGRRRQRTGNTEELVCRDAVDMMTDYMEGALGPDDEERLGAHLRTCEGCSTHLEQLRTTVALLGRLRAESEPSPAKDELVELFRRFHPG